jgi:hypothetical protein
MNCIINIEPLKAKFIMETPKILSNKFYVYILLDIRKPGKYCYDGLNFSFLYEPFYVGRGFENRYKKHYYMANQILDDSLNYKNEKYKNKDPNIHKLRKIKKLLILNINYEHINLKIVEYCDLEYSTYLEKYYIKNIGRNDKKLGPLTNLTDGGEGTIGREYKEESAIKKEISRKKKKYKIINQITKEEIIIDNLKKYCRDNNLHEGLMFSVAHGKTKHHNKYIVYEIGREYLREKYDTPKYHVLNPDGLLLPIFDLISFCKEFELTYSALNRLIHGQASHHKGWTLPK